MSRRQLRARAGKLGGADQRVRAMQRRRARVMGGNDAHFLLRARIANPYLEQEAVQFGLRQWVSPLLLDRILGCEHREPVAERVADPVDGGRPFLHRLE